MRDLSISGFWPGASLFAGRALTGRLLQVGCRTVAAIGWLLFTYYGLRGLALLFLPQAFDPTTHRLSLFAVFYGLDWIATVPPTVALTAKIFGRRNVGLMFGWVIAAHQVGAAAIAYLAGFIRSMDGRYDHAFILSGMACIITAFGVLLIGRGAGENAIQPLAEALK